MNRKLSPGGVVYTGKGTKRTMWEGGGGDKKTNRQRGGGGGGDRQRGE